MNDEKRGQAALGPFIPAAALIIYVLIRAVF